MAFAEFVFDIGGRQMKAGQYQFSFAFSCCALSLRGQTIDQTAFIDLVKSSKYLEVSAFLHSHPRLVTESLLFPEMHPLLLAIRNVDRKMIKVLLYINRLVREFQGNGQPVISVDTKKKELVGDFKNAGKQWRPKQTPNLVRVHDFLIPEKGKAIPYGVYDLTRNAEWVIVGIDHDTASFAVRTILRWWRKMGQPVYPGARQLLITADAGGSNGPRVRLWSWEIQRLADRTGMSITVCHFPPGTSKWNKIEHRLFSYISTNWRGQPLISLAVIVSLIASTRTVAGLRVRAELDKRRYPPGREIPEQLMSTVKLQPHGFHGDWNYTIQPNRTTR